MTRPSSGPRRLAQAWLTAGVLLLPLAASAQPASPAPPPAAPARPGARTPDAALPLPRNTPTMTLPDAERRLVERNLIVLAARYGVDAARAQRLVASSLPSPTVSIGNTIAQFNETNRQAVQGFRVLSPSNNINASLSFLIERGGKRELRTRLAELQITVAEIQVLDALRTQIFQMRQAFFAALQARANLEVALGNRASLDRTEALLRRQLSDGAIPEGDLLRFQASRIQFESDVTNNAFAYASNIAALAALLADDPAAFAPGAGQLAAMGINPRAPAGLGPVPAAGTPARTSGGTGINAPTSVRTILSPVAFDVRGRFDAVPELGIGRDELGQGVVNRADVVAALRQANAADANRLVQQAARSRDVTLGAGWSRSRLSQDLPTITGAIPFATDQFSFNFSFPIFTNRIVEGNIGVAAAQAAQATAQARAALLTARADFATAWANYEQSRSLLGLYIGGALNRAEEAYRSTELAYLAGGRTLLDVLDALRTLNATRIQANNARYSYLLALAQLEQATGVAGVAPRL